MAKSGLRPEVLGNSDGTDGLRMRDMPDLVIHQGVVRCIRMPNRIVVRRERSKAGHQYFTFSTDLATGHIMAYLNDRLAHGKPLHDDSPVISPDYTHKFARGQNSAKEFLPTPRISKLVRNVFRPRFDWRPYVLRPYFDTQLLIAESKGLIAHDFRVFFMGHKGTMEARYTTNKGAIPNILLDEMREAFTRSEKILDQTDQADHMLQHKKQAMAAIDTATPEQLDLVLGVLTGKTGQVAMGS